MPQPAMRLLDLVGPGPIVGPGSVNCFINDIPASLTGDVVTTHGEPPHVNPPTITGSPTVFVNDRPLNAVSLTTAPCGHVGSTGSPTVFVN